MGDNDACPGEGARPPTTALPVSAAPVLGRGSDGELSPSAVSSKEMIRIEPIQLHDAFKERCGLEVRVELHGVSALSTTLRRYAPPSGTRLTASSAQHGYSSRVSCTQSPPVA
jgi:hypothetical protein